MKISKTEWRDILAMMFLAMVFLWGQIQNDVLRSVDGVVYSLVGKELVSRPLYEWAYLTWNKVAYFENPHLTPWLLGLSMKLFGVGTLAALMPFVLLSTATVALTYALGREFIGHRMGLLAGLILTFSPPFIKDGRNPMLEPGMMFFIMLTLFFYLRSAKQENGLRDAIWAGFSFGFAFLAKGPPSLLAPAAIVCFELAGRVFPAFFEKYRVNQKRGLHFAVLLMAAFALNGAIDLWHYALVHESFYYHYFAHQLKYTVVDARGAVANDYGFYRKIFFHYWPWLPLLMGSIPWVLWKKDRESYPALWMSFCVTAGTFLGFTLMKHKAPWYVSIHYVSSSLLAALVLKDWVKGVWMEKYFTRFCMTISVTVLFLSACFPSLFIFPRPYELFLEGAEHHLKNTLEGKSLADCASPHTWQSPFLHSFYLGMDTKECQDVTAPYKLVDLGTYVFTAGDRVIFSSQPFAIVADQRN